MRVIKIELPATMSPVDPNISLASDEIRGQLFQEISALDTEINEVVRQRAKAYFPEAYSVFVRNLLAPDRVGTVTELWIVDPTIRWPAGLLTRSAWRLFIPIFAHVVQEAMASRLAGVRFHIREADAKIVVLAPTRSYKDPVVVGALVFLLTTIYWVLIHPYLALALGSPGVP
jgi:hypothetical protein